MTNFLTTEDWSREALQGLIDRARAFKGGARSDALAGKTVALVFFNASLRTRASFQVAALRLGGQGVVIEPGVSSWPIETGDGVVMDGDAEEHAKEAARVLSRYCDLIAVRAFPKFKDWAVDKTEPALTAFAAHATVPVVNMETIVHPCQELALMTTLQERLGETDAKKFVLTWVPHPKPLNTAVANSALMIATKFGFDVTLAIPDDSYRLDDRFMRAAEGYAAAQGRSVKVTTDVDAAYDGAHAVYAKSWGAIPLYGRREEEMNLRDIAGAGRFIVDEAKMARVADGGVVSHCLPMRRNVKMTDAVADSAAFLGIEEAENRLWTQMAVLAELAT